MKTLNQKCEDLLFDISINIPTNVDILILKDIIRDRVIDKQSIPIKINNRVVEHGVTKSDVNKLTMSVLKSINDEVIVSITRITNIDRKKKFINKPRQMKIHFK